MVNLLRQDPVPTAEAIAAAKAKIDTAIKAVTQAIKVNDAISGRKMVEVTTKFGVTLPISANQFAQKQQGLQAAMATKLQVPTKDVKATVRSEDAALVQEKGRVGDSIAVDFSVTVSTPEVSDNPAADRAKETALKTGITSLATGSVVLDGVTVPQQTISPQFEKKTVSVKIPLPSFSSGNSASSGASVSSGSTSSRRRSLTAMEASITNAEANAGITMRNARRTNKQQDQKKKKNKRSNHGGDRYYDEVETASQSKQRSHHDKHHATKTSEGLHTPHTPPAGHAPSHVEIRHQTLSQHKGAIRHHKDHHHKDLSPDSVEVSMSHGNHPRPKAKSINKAVKKEDADISKTKALLHALQKDIKAKSNKNQLS